MEEQSDLNRATNVCVGCAILFTSYVATLVSVKYLMDMMV
jgi:hypothetical protein